MRCLKEALSIYVLILLKLRRQPIAVQLRPYIGDVDCEYEMFQTIFALIALDRSPSILIGRTYAYGGARARR